MEQKFAAHDMANCYPIVYRKDLNIRPGTQGELLDFEMGALMGLFEVPNMHTSV